MSMSRTVDRDQIVTSLAARNQTFERLRAEAVYEVETALVDAKIKIHTLHSRIKSLDSIYSKAQRKNLFDPVDELTDIVGLRVVAIFLSDLVKIASVLSECFDVQHTDDKLTALLPSQFGYMSMHLIAQIRSSFQGTRYNGIKEIKFEIQLRTIAMDAWAAASHYLDYKSEADVPVDLQRDFHALSGLFYVADQHFELFFKARSLTQEKVEEIFRDSTSPLVQPINFDTVSAFLQRRYPDRSQAQPEDVSALVDSLIKTGLTTLEQLDQVLDQKETAFLQYEKSFPPSDTPDKPKPFTAVGVVRLSLVHRPDFEPDQHEFRQAHMLFKPL